MDLLDSIHALLFVFFLAALFFSGLSSHSGYFSLKSWNIAKLFLCVCT